AGATVVNAVDSRGETHTFDYWSGTGRLKHVNLHDGRVWTFSYSPKGDLMRIEGPSTSEFPSGIWWEWRYTSGSTSAALNHNMTAAIDGRGTAWMKATYDASDRVDTQSVGTGTYHFDYSNIASQHTTVTDRN